MANSNLLKEAIADAKAVRETAIANAKIALEEAFTPRLQSILSQKLQQEIEEGDEEEEVEETVTEEHDEKKKLMKSTIRMMLLMEMHLILVMEKIKLQQMTLTHHQT